MKYSFKSLTVLMYLVGLMWVIQVINIVTDNALLSYGLKPRDLSQWYGIFTSPFLHGGLAHIIGNSLPFVVLGFLVSQTQSLLKVTIPIIILSGMIVWVIGRDAMHVGASGLVMGYWGFLISFGWFNRSFKDILIGVLTLFIYGGLIFTLLDFRQHISFEGHFAGFISGVITAWALVRYKTRRSHR